MGLPSFLANAKGEYSMGPGICKRADGSLFAMYRHGPGPSQLGHGWIVSRTSVNGGYSWSDEVTAYLDPVYSAGDSYPTLLKNGDILCSFFVEIVGGTPITNAVRVMRSRDGGATWSTPVVVPSSFSVFSASSAPIVELSDRLLLPIYGNNGNADGAHLMTSFDGGLTWPQENVISDGDIFNYNQDEPNILIRANGDYFAMMRTSTLGSTSCVSSDHGVTWSAPKTQFTNESAVHLAKLASGAFVGVYRSGNPGQITSIRKSLDEGNTWAAEVNVTGIPGQSEYGTPLETTPGTIGVVWSTSVTSTYAVTQYTTLSESAA